MIEVGICRRSHGLRGGFVFQLHNPSNKDSLFLVPREQDCPLMVFLKPFNEKSTLPIEGKFFALKKISFMPKGKVVADLVGIASIEEADALIPFTVFVDRKDFAPANEQEGEYFVMDLIGLKVLHAESKEELGIVEGSYSNGAQEVLILKLKTGVLELPFVSVFFPEVDLANKCLYMNSVTEIE